MTSTPPYLIQDRTTIVQAVVIITNLTQRTVPNLNYILGTLPFQNLSNQRIKKMVTRIGDIQIRLLAILNSINTKIKVHQRTNELKIKSAQTEKWLRI
ncbi:MAG: hypothetical protein AMR96_02545 [Candidatus Adiutrix intracellularis]|nr:MAG: hypothetical protein AMR96_02545 [Candidatus Adiutrix intracellularis]